MTVKNNGIEIIIKSGKELAEIPLKSYTIVDCDMERDLPIVDSMIDRKLSFSWLVNMLIFCGYRTNVCSTVRGYTSRKLKWRIEAYKGKYGEGYLVRVCRRDTSRYSYGYYWIKQ